MALPLILLGAGIAAVAAGNQLSKSYDKKQGVVGAFPGERKQRVQPVSGSIVCCGIYQFFEHSGIWLDDYAIEQHGSGLVRAVSARRFMENRSGETIFVACDQNARPLSDELAAMRAASKLFEVNDYHLIKNNCNRFVAENLANMPQDLTTFADFNYFLHQHFKTAIHWHYALV